VSIRCATCTTQGARAFALEKNIRLIHGAELAKLLPRVRRA